MDQLETLTIPTETVEFNGKTFEVRGLGLAQITFIVRQHREVVADLYQQAINGKMTGSIEEIALSMIDDFVPLASLVIACGMDSPNSADKAAKLPLAVQAQFLEKIVSLTLMGEGGLEKLMEIVVRVMEGAARITHPKT
ncbi:phage pre-tape measure protein [Manganibacter manganicus]|uniref:Uncharacterized protein n=1 Tax=Manganibacter manganicus TaxID=1873176 RepID=A0A1V8RR21_9HYPH|nr:hypothetical protein [Pseudaminobacter manganicus]OQM75598.1 hypothetical protein BFN67_17655 [Pseudaminobacter manganicus]